MRALDVCDYSQLLGYSFLLDPTSLSSSPAIPRGHLLGEVEEEITSAQRFSIVLIRDQLSSRFHLVIFYGVLDKHETRRIIKKRRGQSNEFSSTI